VTAHPRVAFCELPDGLAPGDGAWQALAARLAARGPALAILNELPFGSWLPTEPVYDVAAARAAVAAHDRGLAAIAALAAGGVLASRPVAAGDRLANEAFLHTADGYRTVHHKQYFPEESGFHEATWFRPARPGFDVIEHAGLRIGVLLCTELMFNEWARHYRRQGAHVIAVPRASGRVLHRWRTAAAMAAIVSGCYVVSSNRAGGEFGGSGLAYAPDGTPIAETSADEPVIAIDVDVEAVKAAQAAYPCYVPEL
jgi:N-carbamoylputrescine amidase